MRTGEVTEKMLDLVVWSTCACVRVWVFYTAASFLSRGIEPLFR